MSVYICLFLWKYPIKVCALRNELSARRGSRDQKKKNKLDVVSNEKKNSSRTDEEENWKNVT